MNFDPSTIAGDFSTNDGVIAVTTTPALFVGANPNRVTLLVVNNTASPFFIRPYQMVSTAIGIQVLSNTLQLYKYHDFGALVGQQWSCVSSVGAVSGYFIEVIFQPDRGP